MKRSRKIGILSFVLLLPLAYAAWCGRSFYLSVPLPELSQLPEKDRAPALDLIESCGLTEPEPLSFSRALDLLSHPGDSHPSPVLVFAPEPGSVTVNRNAPPLGHITFVESGTGWTVSLDRSNPSWR